MKMQDELLRMKWELEEDDTNDVHATTGSIQPARMGWIRRGFALTLVAVLGFMAGVLLGPTLHHDGAAGTPIRLVIPGTVLAPPLPTTGLAPAQPATPVMTGALYDDGWAGGPGNGYHPPTIGPQRLPTWMACSTCYDQGWAGGPGQGYQPAANR